MEEHKLVAIIVVYLALSWIGPKQPLSNTGYWDYCKTKYIHLMDFNTQNYLQSKKSFICY